MLPALDEAATVGSVVREVATLHPVLVDEVVVVDGGSTDGTADVAAAAGARVHTGKTLQPDHGEPAGKGDALWRGLSTTTGDLVVFCDTDVRNFRAGFVTGLLGPLLTDPAVAFVKAFYDRPVAVDDVLHAGAGGRVTELTARPLLNLFWPELAGFVQPLSGECAARRSLLEALPFFTGYGVEFGLLVDTCALAGVDAMAQVDLGERVHRNQSLAALSRMAYGVVQVAARRLAAQGRVTLPSGDVGAYLQFDRRADVVTAAYRDVGVVERPPLKSLR